METESRILQTSHSYDAGSNRFYVEHKKQVSSIQVVRLEQRSGVFPEPVFSHSRYNYSISLLKGRIRFAYADRTVESRKASLVFSSPQIPYMLELKDKITEGMVCIIPGNFLKEYFDPEKLDVFRPGGPQITGMDEVRTGLVESILKSIEEIISGGGYETDLFLAGNLSSLFGFANRSNPGTVEEKKQLNSYCRISSLFMELLDRQFPINSEHRHMTLRTPSDFALQLNIPVLYLNKALQVVNRKTTRQLINERIFSEARALLQLRSLSIPDIANALGFRDVWHFNNFFRDNSGLSPAQYRDIEHNFKNTPSKIA